MALLRKFWEKKLGCRFLPPLVLIISCFWVSRRGLRMKGRRGSTLGLLASPCWKIKACRRWPTGQWPCTAGALYIDGVPLFGNMPLNRRILSWTHHFTDRVQLLYCQWPVNENTTHLLLGQGHVSLKLLVSDMPLFCERHANFKMAHMPQQWTWSFWFLTYTSMV